MKYERKTKKEFGDVYSFNGKIYYDDTADIVERLAELEDKIESGELVERSELDKALAEKQERGQDLTVETIFRYTAEIKALQAEIDEYRQKIKDGTLIQLPCKIGDVVYHIYKNPFSDYFIDKEVVYGYEYNNDGIGWRLRLNTCYPSVSVIGDNIFLTREDAEKKLKELKGEE